MLWGPYAWSSYHLEMDQIKMSLLVNISYRKSALQHQQLYLDFYILDFLNWILHDKAASVNIKDTNK